MAGQSILVCTKRRRTSKGGIKVNLMQRRAILEAKRMYEARKEEVAIQRISIAMRAMGWVTIAIAIGILIAGVIKG